MNKHGERSDYVHSYLRRSWREGTKVRKETIANLSALPDHVIASIIAGLHGERLVPAGAQATITRSLPHGHVAAVWAQAQALGLPALLGPASPARDLVLGLIIARICKPGSKLATTRWWQDTTLAEDLGIADAGTDEVYAAMDWLTDRQEGIEKKLAGKHLGKDANPDRLALFDLSSSSWVTGSHCELAARGYSRDGKKGLPQIEYGLLTDPDGRPVAIRVVPGNTADPAAFEQIAIEMKTTFGVQEMVMVGDRGMITSARIRQLKDLDGLGWVTALRSISIASLVADGSVQQSLFDEANLAELAHPDYPGERLIACRNPALADKRAYKREELLTATEGDLATIAAAVTAGRLTKAGSIGVRVGKVLGKHNMAKHFTLTIDDGVFAFTRNQASIDAETELDGIYIIRTSVPAGQMDTTTIVGTYKSLGNVERDFRCLKAIDLDLRPIYHFTETRVRAHVFLCMLSAYLVWHLRRAWAPLTYTDENRPDPVDPVAPAKRSNAAEDKASTHADADGHLVRSFRSLLDHLATLTRNDIRYGDDPYNPTISTLAIPTTVQHRAFELLGQPIPIALK
ncbi:MAG: IS1634 family transposase [Microbacteriaceae bacterium]|nr:MAG: IS1634 family transposase [Microbacteriaceae bacterium]